MKANFLERVIILHSYLYYELDEPVWTDKQFDSICRQLVSIFDKHDQEWIEQTQYGYAFYDFDGTTAFDIWSRLEYGDRNVIMRLVRNHYIVGRMVADDFKDFLP